MDRVTNLSCACGQVQIAVHGTPLIAAECHCTSCREAGVRMATLPGTVEVTAPNGGTQYVLYRKDRVVFSQGLERLGWFVLKPGRTTRRAVATCCNTPIFVEFKGGHWLSLYSALWPDGTAPKPQLRSMTGDRPAGAPLDDSIASGGWATSKFYAKLLGAWIAMGFKVPKVALGGGEVKFPREG